MNPQYLQSSYYGGQSTNLPYGEPNANYLSKSTNDPQSLQQKSAPPISQPNQSNIVTQMSNVSLTASQKPLSTQNFQEQNSFANGMNNHNNFSLEGKTNINNANVEKPVQPSQGSQLQSSSLPYTQGFSEATQFSSQQYSTVAQPLNSGLLSGSNIPKNMPQAQINSNQTNLVGPTIPNQQQQQYQSNKPHQMDEVPMAGGRGPIPPMAQNKQNLSGPPVPTQNLQNLSRPLYPGQQNNFMGSSMTEQQNKAGPPVQNNNQNLPPRPGQQTNILSGPPMMGQQNLIKPPYQQTLPSGQQNFSAPSMQGQQNMANNPYSNQMIGQKPHSHGPPLTGQPSNPPYGMNQGFQQTGFGPGQPPIYGNNQPGMYQGGFQPNAQAQPKKLDPDNMPNPIQVIQDDQRLKGGDFITNQRGLVPPLVTTKFVVHDQGNASPRFIRSSMYTVPTTADMMKQAQVPFGIILSPMAQVEEGEYEPPIVNMGEIGPIRCIRCKAYMCPFMQFVDAGRRFQCMFCKATTEVPQEYFQHLDHTGQRMDRHERPELMYGTYEFVATKEYCKENTFPKIPAIIFVIDVSYNNIKSGFVNLLCSQMKEILRNLPVDAGQAKSNMKIGFITYNNSIHFYNCKANLAQPQMLYVGDVNDVFMPLLEGFLVDPEESEATIDSLMTQIPAMFGDTRETECNLGSAIQAGLEALKASECAGKLLIFQSSLPSSEAPGKLKNRDDRNVLGTDKEKSVLAPQTNFYNTLGQECVTAGCSVDLFLLNNSYIDIATIGQISRITGGEVYKYTYFQADIDGDRLITDVINNISRPIAFDAVMRVRTSTGVRPTDFYGHLHMTNTTDIELASIDSDKAITIEIKHDDKLTEEEGVFIQAALLYTSCGGVRRLRIINLSLKTSSMMAELYRSCDCDAVINFFLKQSVTKMIESSAKAIRDNLNSKSAQMLATYRKHCASPSNAGQLILPECLKLLPLYVNSLLKSDSIAGGVGITIDQKSFVMMLASSMSINETVVHVYPRLISLHDCDPSSKEIPPMLRCSIEKFQDDGVYLLENGIHMFIWLGLNLNPQWVQAVFGVASVVQIDTDKTTIPVLDNSLNVRIRDIISQVQSERRYCMRLTLTRQRDKMESVMRQFLVEDRGIDGSPSYIDYLCHMHKEIRQLLS